MNIPGNDTPASAFKKSWALVNLISAILTVAGAVYLWLASYKKKDQEEQEMDEEENKKRPWILRIIASLIGIASVVVFILTENMANPMVLVDKWTILMIALLVVQLVPMAVKMLKNHRKEEQKENA